jgi:hypothetical protein
MRHIPFALLVLACAPQATTEPWLQAVPEAEVQGAPVRVVGVVEHSELEGGFYLIRGSDGKAYDPMNLPDEFRKAGLPIEADVIVRPDQVSIRQVGSIVQVVRIRKRPAGTPTAPDKTY